MQPNLTADPRDGPTPLDRPLDELAEVVNGVVYRTSPVKRFRRTKVEIEALHDTILAACEEDHPLSVRGVFYRAVSAGAIDKTEKAYATIQREVLKLRRSGRLSYDWIADGTRLHLKSPSWDNAQDALDNLAASYRRAQWPEQPVYVEVWSEKEAISSIVHPVTNRWDVPLMIARGFASESFLYKTAAAIRAAGKPAVVYQLGDHDPSGVAAWQHIQRRLRDFAPNVEITFERLAVTKAQIAEYQLPTRPTKTTDSRSKSFDGESVEVDAIPTRILQAVVEKAITSWIDSHALQITRMVEESERRGLLALARGWPA